MSADLRTVALPSGGEVTYDADMPIGAVEDIQTAAESGKLGSLREALSEFVVEWTFDGSPTNPEDWKPLRRSVFSEAITAIMEDLGKLGN